MLKINYPHKYKKIIEDEYISIFDIDNSKYAVLRRLINDPNLPLTVEDLLVDSIENLAKYSFRLRTKKYIHLRKILKKFFNYDNYQKDIAEFFISNRENINLSTCYYCNIDYINVFNDIGDFSNGLDLIKRGNINDFIKITGFQYKSAKKINQAVNSIDSLIQLTKPQRANLKNISLKKAYSHFTIDHVLNKAQHPLISLSLYNFVPSCYACNSKFKNQAKLIRNPKETFLSPTSRSFNFNNDVNFKLHFPNKKINTADINNIDEFRIDYNFAHSERLYNRYLSIFKLKGRYVSHKEQALDLIKKIQDYNDSTIKEIAKITKHSEIEIKSNIFGSELFKGNLEDNPFTKFKRDIAKNIGIKGVV